MERNQIIGVIVRAALIAVIIAVVMSILYGAGLAEDLYVTADLLNGRARPSRRSSVEAVFDRGDKLTPTGEISRDREWVEVYGGECGTVWVHISYVTERTEVFTVRNTSGGRVKARNWPGGKLKKYVRAGKTVEIDRVVLGWGHCSAGWVDLDWFEEVDAE